MRRAILFSSRFMLGLWIVFVSAALLLLFSSTPTAAAVPFSSVSIRDSKGALVYLPTRLFSCEEAPQQFQCKATVQKRSLEITWEKQKDDQGYPTSSSRCEARYNGQPIDCKYSGPGGVIGLPDEYEVTGLGLSSQQMSAMQRRYWGLRFLKETREAYLLSIGTAIGLTGGVIVACFVWLHPGRLSKLFASFVCGLALYQGAQGRLSNIFYSLMMPPPLPPSSVEPGMPVPAPYIEGVADVAYENSMRIAQAGAIAIGVIGMAIVAWVLLRQTHWLIKGIASIIIGIGVYVPIARTLQFNLMLGLGDLLFPTVQESPLLWKIFSIVSVAAAIAAVVLLWNRTDLNSKRLVSFMSGAGVSGIVSFLSLFILLWLGYAD